MARRPAHGQAIGTQPTAERWIERARIASTGGASNPSNIRRKAASGETGARSKLVRGPGDGLLVISGRASV